MFRFSHTVVLAATFSVFPVSLSARTFIVPHVIETNGTTINPNQFDTSFEAVYTAGMVDGEPVSNATVNVYFFNNAGAPIMSANASPVCNPCVFGLNSATRKLGDSFDNLINAAGGFPGGVVIGFALFEVTGDDDHVAISAVTVNSHTSAFDLSLFHHDVPELPAGLDPSLRLIVFPHVIEGSTATNVAQYAFDTNFYAAYGGGVGGSSIPAGTGATVSLYLFNDNGTLKKSATNNNVCAPCTQAVSAGSPKASFSLQNSFVAAGGFASGVEVGFALVSINGTADAVAVQGVFVNSHTNPFDLAMSELEGREVPTSTPPTAIDSPPSLGSALRSWPNPLHENTRIDYTLPGAGDATVEIVDVTGRIVARPVRGHHAVGDHQIEWNGRGDDGTMLPSGVYFARLVTAEGVRTLKMTLVR